MEHEDPSSITTPIDPNENNFIKKVLGQEGVYVKKGYFYVWEDPIDINSDFNKLDVCFGSDDFSMQAILQFKTGNIESDNAEYKPIEFYKITSGLSSPTNPNKVEHNTLEWQGGEKIKLESNKVYQIICYAGSMLWKSFSIDDQYYPWDGSGTTDKVLDQRECLPVQYYYNGSAIELQPNVIYDINGYDKQAKDVNVTLKEPYDGQVPFYVLVVNDNISVNLPEQIKFKNPIIIQENVRRIIYILNNLATVIYI